MGGSENQPSWGTQWHRATLVPLYANGKGIKQDCKEAVMWCRKAAAQEYASAPSYLGGMYTKDQSVKQDDKEAVTWYRRAAEQGCAGAQLNLGCMYADNAGVPQGFAEALQWFQLAAEQGREDALKAWYNKITAGAFRFFRTVARLLCSARAPCNAASRGCWRASDASQPIYLPLERAGRSSTAKWKRGSGLQLGAVSQ